MTTIKLTKQNLSQTAPVLSLTTTGRRRRRKARTVVIQQPLITKGRTLRNRRRRMRRRMQGPIAPQAQAGYFSRYFTHNDPTMEVSVHQNLQTLFYPQKGIHRGIANGLEPTAIAYYQGSYNLDTTSSNNVLTFLAIPALVAKAAVAGEGNFFSTRNNTVITDPNGVGGAQFPGPFAVTNPMVSGRVVSFSLTVIPQSNVLNRGGAGKFGYVPEYLNNAWTQTSLDNFSISRAVDGVESMTMHWVPGVNEYDFGAGTSTTATYSGLFGYINTAIGTAQSWRAEWQIGIEYNPTAAYKPLVDRKPPGIRPDARYFVNQVVQKHWTPLMISTWHNYESRLNMAESLGGISDFVYVDHAGSGGVGFNNPTNADIEYDLEEKIENPFENSQSSSFRGVTRAVANTLCSVAEQSTGEDICSDPVGSLGRMGLRSMGFGPSGNGPRRLRN